LSLALAVLTFNIHIIGERAYHICRYTLPALKPLNDACPDLEDEDNFTFLICLQQTEIVGCLFRHEVPSMRPQAWSERWVNRYLGVSSPLLAYSYDLCILCSKIHQARESEIGEIHLITELRSLESTITMWRPTYPDDFLSRYSQAEVAHMLAQVQIFRNALLLVCHRLRHPLGTSMDRAIFLAETILEQFDMVRILAQKTVLSMDFAFVIASFEMDDSMRRKDALSKIGDFTIAMSWRTRLKGLLQALWQTTDTHTSLYWSDLAGHLVQYLD
jgi:hypothetical protein